LDLTFRKIGYLGFELAMGSLLMKKQLDMKIESDKIKHFTVCVIVGLTASVIEAVYGANYLQSFFAGYMAGLAIGVGKEYGDKCNPSNKWDWSDIGADAVGSIVGAALGALASFIH
jgi:uncharacterized protein YfiM (DUF2279 family)